MKLSLMSLKLYFSTVNSRETEQEVLKLMADAVSWQVWSLGRCEPTCHSNKTTWGERKDPTRPWDFHQSRFKLTYNGSIVGFFTEPELSQLLHQVFSNITNHQRFTLQRGKTAERNFLI